MHPALAPIQAAVDRDDIAGAARLAKAALQRGVEDPLVLNLAAWDAERAGDLEAAETLLARGVALAPRDETLLVALGSLRRQRLRPGEALAVLDRALAVAPSFPLAWHEKGLVLEMLGDRAGARDAHRRAAEADPSDPAPPASLAALASLEGDWKDARRFAMQALRIDLDHGLATCILARVEIAEGKAGEARERLERLLGGDLPDDVRATALGLRGEALDLLDDPAAAFADFVAAKRIERDIHAPTLGADGPIEEHLAFVRRIHASFRAQPPERWIAPSPSQAARSPVFVLGYPRSGTTLVESLLLASGGHSVEERPTLLDAERAFLADNAGFARLAVLPQEEAERYRGLYWDRVAAEGIPAGDGLFVDMAPLNGAKLPLIAKLFPDARLIVVRRDPRDVVLSCLRQRFQMNVATYVFTDLVATAQHYAAVMAVTDDYLRRLPVRAHIVRYRDIVADFDAVVRAAYGFLGLAWTGAARDFDRQARDRTVRTASATQVRRPLFNGDGQWRRYARELAPVLPILEPWIERYGFPPTDGIDPMFAAQGTRMVSTALGSVSG